MIRTVAIFTALFFVGPSLACDYHSADGTKLETTPSGVSFAYGNTKVNCTTFGGGTGVMVQGVSCDDGYEGTIFSVSSKPNGPADLTIFYNTVWYRRCK